MRPNILLVITHDSGRHFGCCGADVQTPNIDRIGHEGARFANAFCTAPQCSPARASLLSGMYPHRHGLIGLTHRGFRMNPDAPRLPGLLAELGYHTILFGVHHEEPDPRKMGYRRIVETSDRTIRGVLPQVENFLGGSPGEPLFACVGFNETHRPFDPARHPMDNPDEVIVPEWLPDEPAVRADIAQLNGVVRGVDEAIGRIDAALSAAGLARNTLLIYTTDHGIAFPMAKGTLLDAGLGVVLVARGPGGFAAGQVRDELVSTMDLTPTLLELAGAGAEKSAGMDGRSLLPLVGASSSATVGWREHLFAEQTFHAAYDPMRAIRTSRYKYIRSFARRPVVFAPNVDESPTKDQFIARGLHRQVRAEEMLFDLSADPLEHKNLVGHPATADVLAELRGKLAAWMQESCDPLLAGPVPPPAGTQVTPAGAIRSRDLDASDDWEK